MLTSTESHKADFPLKSVFSAKEKVKKFGSEFPLGIQHYAYTGIVLAVETGTYELNDLSRHLRAQLKTLGIDFDMIGNLNTLCCAVKCSRQVDWDHLHSFGHLLGFQRSQNMIPGEWNYSKDIVHVFTVDSLNVEASCILGEWQGDRFSDIIHQFWPNVPPGYRINEIPRPTIYYPLIEDKLENLQVRILDQQGELVDFRGKEISVRLHFYRMQH